MVSSPHSVLTPVLEAVPAAPVPLAPDRLAPARALAPGGRAAQPVTPGAPRRDPVRPGARPVRMDGTAGVRPVRGGCAAEGRAPRVAEQRHQPGPAPLRLTERGRRAVAGLSIAIGLCIAAGTAVSLEVGRADGGLQLAGASTVVVQPGDTLWSIARSVAPEEDPRAVIDAIVDLNGLEDVDLLPGAELQLP